MLLTFAVLFVLSTFWAARQYKAYKIETLRYELFRIRDDLRDRAIDDPVFGASDDFLETDDILTVLCSHFDYFTFFTLARARAERIYGPNDDVEGDLAPECKQALRSATRILVESLQVKHLSLFPLFLWMKLRGKPRPRSDSQETIQSSINSAAEGGAVRKRYVADPRTATSADFVRASHLDDHLATA